MNKMIVSNRLLIFGSMRVCLNSTAKFFFFFFFIFFILFFFFFMYCIVQSSRNDIMVSVMLALWSSSSTPVLFAFFLFSLFNVCSCNQ